MAEVTVWIDEGDKRVTFTAEHPNKEAALVKAQNFIETELDDAEEYGTYAETPSFSRDVQIGRTTPVIVGEPGPELITPISLTGPEAIERLRKAMRKYADAAKVIDLAQELGYKLTEWQKEVIRQWFDK
ncbi:hypothetical protein [Micromonospora chokoriensis]